MVIQENLSTNQRVIAINCPFCSKQLGINEGNVQKVLCQSCNNSFHYPELTDSEKIVVVLASINGTLRGISNSIWTVFFYIPLFVGFCWGVLIFFG